MEGSTASPKIRCIGSEIPLFGAGASWQYAGKRVKVMKRIRRITIPSICMVLVIFAAGCSKKTSVFGLDSSSDAEISVTAESAQKGSSALGHMTIQGNNITIDAHFEDNGKIEVRYARGEYDADRFPEEAQEITVSGNDSANVDGLEPGGYTVQVTAADDLNGTAVIHSVPGPD